MVVEVGIKLNRVFDFYDKMLKSKGIDNCFNCVTHDVYYSNKDLTGMSENEMKNACIRFRNPDETTRSEEEDLINKGYIKVFDTVKKDHHYATNSMKSRIQLQEIENIGLLVYYDNPDYYELNEEDQRKKLIDELNSYGFEFDYNILGLDKLRTLYYGKEMYSKNQNS